MRHVAEVLDEQRWDDHRYYHHSRINQSLHLVSAISFLVSYALLFVNPAVAALLAWTVAMTTRQIGHFFFEPKDYDTVNQATHEYKESVKVGYNLYRKVILLSVWAALPVYLLFDPSCAGFLQSHTTVTEYALNVGWTWFWLGIAGALFRVAQLTVQQSFETGAVWLFKILTDPFHDIKLYWSAPLALMRGELIDPQHGIRHH